MKLKEFLEHLGGIDPEIEVVVEIRGADEYEEEVGESVTDGQLCDIEGSRSILIQYGKLTIIADVMEEV